tara:strand:- start:547 stop:1128 length:582 start_codon:yes stop_codon:yes gene_type:complete
LVWEIAGSVFDHVGLIVLKNLGDMGHVVSLLLNINVVRVDKMNLVISRQVVILVKSLLLGIHSHFLDDEFRVWHLQEWEEVTMLALSFHFFGVSSSVFSIVVVNLGVTYSISILNLVLIIARIGHNLAMCFSICVLDEEFVGAERIDSNKRNLASLLDVADILNRITQDSSLASWSCDVTILCLSHILHLPNE